jgi:hypothetical protein
MTRLALALVTLSLVLPGASNAATHSPRPPVSQPTRQCDSSACADSQQSGGAVAQQAPAEKDASGLVEVVLLVSLLLIVPVVWTRQRARGGPSRSFPSTRPTIRLVWSRSRGEQD